MHMNNFEDVLDSSSEEKKQYFRLTEPIDRGLQCLMDFGIITILTVVSSTIISSTVPEYKEKVPFEYVQLVWLGIYCVYYFTFEYFAQATIGKLVRRTRVMTVDEKKPTALQVLTRMVSRLIPLGFILLYTPYKITLHDLFSKTRVQKKVREWESRLPNYSRQLKPRNFRR